MIDEIDLKSLLKYFWKRKKIMLYIILGFFILANIVFFVFTKFVYSNTGKVKISGEANANKIASYNDLLTSDSVVESAIVNSNIDANSGAIKSNLSINASVGSRIYTITLKYRDKEDGNKLCESIIETFINRLSSYDGSSGVVYDNVTTSSKPVNLNLVKNELLYIIAGCVIAFGYVFVLYYFDDKIKSESELDNFNNLGKILDSKDKEYKNNISLIKTKIKLNNLGNVIFINTAREIDCKDDVLNLVKDFSKDSKVILIDTNIRNKSKGLGYSNLLDSYKEDVSKYLTNNKEYDVIECGTCNKETDILLSSKNNEKLINNLKKKYDYVLLYNSNVVDYSDSLIISKLCNCNYILVEINKTNKKDLKKALELYKQVNTEVNGIIIIDKEGKKIFK